MEKSSFLADVRNGRKNAGIQGHPAPAICILQPNWNTLLNTMYMTTFCKLAPFEEMFFAWKWAESHEQKIENSTC